MRAVDADYVAQAGEVVFDHYASTGDLAVAFPQYSADQLAQAKTDQIELMYADYAAAIAQPVAYTSKAGVAKTFQSDPTSISNVNDMLSAYVGAQATPADFYWVAEDNTKVPFTYADLQGLAAAMGAQGWAAFQNLQAKKSAIKGATTVPAVQAVTWS
jgi:hypothetical protein